MIGISDFARSYLRSRATELMDSSKDTCQIRRPGVTRTVYDPVTRKTTTVSGSVVYEGSCRLWTLPAGGSVWSQDKENVQSLTRLSIPWDAPTPEPGDLVTMTGSDDPRVIGRSMKVESISRGGGLRGSRVLEVKFVDTEGEGDV